MDDRCKEEFIKTGMWPNEVMWKLWCTAWRIASAVPAAAPAAPPGDGEHAITLLRSLLAIVQRYLPPDGPSENETLGEIIGLVDPWPLAASTRCDAEPSQRSRPYVVAWRIV